MASRILHLSVSRELERYIEIKDKNRFAIGHILPDAMVSKSKFDFNTHFSRISPDGTKKVMDFGDFYERFKEEIHGDELYLGYYFHLIEDVIFRNMLYYDLKLLNFRNNKEFLRRLYRDYSISGLELIEKYGIKDDLYVPEDFEKEKILEIAPFEIKEFLEQMKEDFVEKYDGEPMYFGSSQGEIYIQRCAKIIAQEYEAMKNGSHTALAKDFYWDIVN